MTKAEFCIATRKAEFPAFVRVLKALGKAEVVGKHTVKWSLPKASFSILPVILGNQ